MCAKSILHAELSYRVVGCLYQAHNKLGRFRNEKQYGDFLENIFKENNIRYVREYSLPPSFNGEHQNRNRVDFLIEDTIILELKTRPVITREDYLQAQRYLVASNKDLALLVDFRYASLKPKRVINMNKLKGSKEK